MTEGASQNVAETELDPLGARIKGWDKSWIMESLSAQEQFSVMQFLIPCNDPAEDWVG